MARDLFEEAGIAPQSQAKPRDLFKEAGVEAPTVSNWASPVDLGIAAGSRALVSPLGPLSGYAGLLGTLLPGPQGQGEKWTRAVQEAQENLTYDPKTSVGKVVLDAVRYPFRALADWGTGMGESAYSYDPKTQTYGSGQNKLSGALTEGIINTAPSAILSALGGEAISAVRNNSLAARSRNAVADETLRQGKEAGYVFPPSATAGRNFLTDLLESVAGKAAMKQEAVNRNQPLTTAIATNEAGLPANTALSPEVLAARRQAAAQPYRDAAAIDPVVAQDVQALTDARRDAQDAWRAYRGPNGRSADRHEAMRLDQRVNSLEQQIETAAQNAGIPGLVERIRAARQQIAKIHNIEEGVNRGTGAVSARPIGDAYANGAPLTGGLETIGRVQNAYPSLLGDAASNPAPGVSALRPIGAAALGLEGAHLSPGAAAIGGLPLLGGPMRSLLYSDPAQALFARPPLYLGSRIPQVSDPLLRAILASTPVRPSILEPITTE